MLIILLSCCFSSGYGNIAPSTEGGKIFCILYAIFGIPLFGFLLAGVGDQLGTIFVKSIAKVEKVFKVSRITVISLISVLRQQPNIVKRVGLGLKPNYCVVKASLWPVLTQNTVPFLYLFYIFSRYFIDMSYIFPHIDLEPCLRNAWFWIVFRCKNITMSILFNSLFLSDTS